MANCSIFSCKNNPKKTRGLDIKYYKFPKNEDLRNQWIAACGRQNLILKNATVCSNHFSEDCFVRTLRQKLMNYCPKTVRNLKNDAVPTKHLHNSKVEIISNNNKNKEESCINFEDEKLPRLDNVSDVGCSQINRISELQQELDALVSENSKLKSENHDLQKQNIDLMQQLESLKNVLPSKVNELLRTILTPAQANVLLGPKVKQHTMECGDCWSAYILSKHHSEGISLFKS